MEHIDSRTDAPLSRFLKPARAARHDFTVHRYRRALLGQRGPSGILAVPTRDPKRDRAFAALFGPDARRWHLNRGA